MSQKTVLGEIGRAKDAAVKVGILPEYLEVGLIHSVLIETELESMNGWNQIILRDGDMVAGLKIRLVDVGLKVTGPRTC